MCNFTTYDGNAINNEDRKEFQIRKDCQNVLDFVTFKELWEKLAFLKIAANVFEAGDFLKFF